MKAPRRLLRFGLLAVLLVGLVVFVFQYRMKNPPARGPEAGDVIVEIPPGTPTSEIFRRLDAAGVIEDARLAEIYYRLHRRRTVLQAGEYRF